MINNKTISLYELMRFTTSNALNRILLETINDRKLCKILRSAKVLRWPSIPLNTVHNRNIFTWIISKKN